MSTWKLLGVIFAAGCVSMSTATVTILTEEGSVPVRVEVADTIDKRVAGLMNRSSLPEDSGMLFVFSSERHRTFWMKDTLIPLDILFLAEDGTIVDIQQMEPCTSMLGINCPRYRSAEPARYALEVNKGFAVRHGVEVGDIVLTPPA